MSELNIGRIITNLHQRDAIHVAIAPVLAGGTVSPGQHVGFVNADDTKTVGHSKKTIGIIDPFLKKNVEKGQWCWLFLYPNAVTSLRHEWTHPSFPVVAPDEYKQASVAWLSEYATIFELTFADFMDAAKEWVNNHNRTMLRSDTPDEAFNSSKNEEMWRHYEVVTGTKPADTTENFFRCGC